MFTSAIQNPFIDSQPSLGSGQNLLSSNQNNLNNMFYSQAQVRNFDGDISDYLPQEYNFKTLAGNVDSILSSKYPQLSKLIRYPNRNNQMKVYQHVFEKAVQNAQRKNEKPLYKEEEANAKVFYDESVKLGKENMKTFLILNQQKTHNIPEEVRKALLSLKLYYDIPIIDGVLMSPYQNNSNWKNGKLMSLTIKKLREHLKTKVDFSNEKELVKYPEYRLLRGYIRGPAQYRKIKAILDKQEAAFKNPKKLANRVWTHIKKKGIDTFAQPTPNKYLSGSDLNNLNYLSDSLTYDKLNAQKDRTEKLKPFIDRLIGKGDLRGDSLGDYYKKFAPPYAKLLNKNL